MRVYSLVTGAKPDEQGSNNWVIDGSLSATGKPISGAMVTVGSKVTRTTYDGCFEIDSIGTAVQARFYGYTRAQVAGPLVP